MILDGFSIPASFQEKYPELDATVQEGIIEPAIQVVSADIAPIGPLLMELRGLVGQGEHNPYLFYKKLLSFGVSDSSTFQDGGPLPRLLKLKDVSGRVLRDGGHQDLGELAEHVMKWPDESFAFVEGSTLEEALARYLTILGMNERLRELYP